MKNKKIRDAINRFVKENELEEKIYLLENHAYDNSIIGLTEDNIIVYDYEKMIQEFMEDEKCDEIDAIEWLDYNTLRALPYMGERKPIILKNTLENIKENY